MLRAGMGQILKKEGESDFRFIQHKVVHIPEFIMPGGKQGTPGYDLCPEPATSLNDSSRRRFLDGHRAQKHVIRPDNLAVFERTDIEINQRFLPLGGEHGSHGQKTQGRLAGLL